MGVVLHDEHHHHPDLESSETLIATNITPSRPNINVRAAFIHVIGDLIQSVGVVLAAALVWWDPSWRIADPICTFLFSLLVIASTWMLAREAIVTLMEGTPASADPQALKRALLEVQGVLAVHDLHIWSLSPGKVSATVHVIVSWTDLRNDASLYGEMLLRCQQVTCAHHIHHATIQIDPDRQLEVHCRDNCCGSDDDFLANSQPC